MYVPCRWGQPQSRLCSLEVLALLQLLHIDAQEAHGRRPCTLLLSLDIQEGFMLSYYRESEPDHRMTFTRGFCLRLSIPCDGGLAVFLLLIHVLQSIQVFAAGYTCMLCCCFRCC
jgi:hypothetical protein